MWKIAPALALGNAVVLKPASVTPLTSLLFAELLAEAGLPPGAFQVLTGPGAVIGKAMAEHPGIDKISFTGETQTGQSDPPSAGGGSAFPSSSPPFQTGVHTSATPSQLT